MLQKREIEEKNPNKGNVNRNEIGQTRYIIVVKEGAFWRTIVDPNPGSDQSEKSGTFEFNLG